MEEKNNKNEIQEHNETGKKKRKFNLIDLIFILIIIGVGFAVVYKPSTDNDIEKNRETFIVTYYTNDVLSFVADDIKIGEKLMDDNNDVDLGIITDFTIEDSVIYNTNSDGQTVLSTNPDYKSVYIVGKVKAEDFSNGIRIEGNKYGIGHSMTLRAGKAKIWLIINDIRPATQEETDSKKK